MQGAPTVAVIGGGWAGCAAAVTLARLGHRVHLCEAAPVLGGRARRVERAGLALDNGQHLLLGAYRQALELIAAVHDDDAPTRLFTRRPFAFVPAAGARGEMLALRGFDLPAPWGLAAGLMLARGLSLRERIGTAAWLRRLARGDFRCPIDQTVAGMLASGPPRAAALLWNPLCLAALNTPPAAASAQVFANVLQAAFTGPREGSHLLVPKVDLTALFPDAAASFVERHGGTVACGTRTVVESIESDRVVLRAGDRSFEAARVVVAVGPHQLRDALGSGISGTFPDVAAALRATDLLRYEPIVTVWLGYPAAIASAAPLLRLDDAPGQWAFDRSGILRRGEAVAASALAQLFAVVISADGPHAALDHATLQAQCDAQLRRLLPGLPRCTFARTFAERRATYACEPRRPVPASANPAPRLHLAGDYLDRDLPATLEAAVRTGVRAALDADHAAAAPP